MTIAEQIIRAKTDYDEVYKAGKQSEYDRFWDSFQQNGKRTEYFYAFNKWTGKTFRPKYDIKPSGSADSIFRNITGITEESLDNYLAGYGVVFDASEITSFNDAFYATTFKYINELNLSKCSAANFLFVNAKITRIEKIITKANGSITFSNAFLNTYNLKHIIFEGGLANNMNFAQSSMLDYESLTSIINALIATTANRTLTLHSNSKAKLTEADIATITEKGWTLA